MFRTSLKDKTVFELLELYSNLLKNTLLEDRDFIKDCLIDIEDEMGDRTLEAVAEGIEHHEKAYSTSREITGASASH